MSKGRHLIDSLPELPLEPFQVAGKLSHARRGPFLTIVPEARPAPVPPEPLPHAKSGSSFEIRKYWTQAIYPRVICIDPGDFINEVALPAALGDDGGGSGHDHPVGPTSLEVLARREQHYKLTSLNGSKLHHALWCTVKYGPWLAVASETESCVDGIPNRWEFAIVEMPEVAMLWYGEWLDQPSLPNLTVIKGDLAMFNVTRQCCAGYKWCPTTQSCIPNQVNCQTPVPI